MAKQVITLGIGPTDNLNPFILTGLDVTGPIIATTDRATFKGMWRGMFRKMNLATLLVTLWLLNGN